MITSTDTIVIAESSSTRTEWALVERGRVVERAFTTGLNPYFLSRRDISHIIRLELPSPFFKRRWGHVFFYGAGCSTPDKNKIVESSVVAQLGTGSNSCYYDGQRIVKNVRPLGFILGDEGSGSALGRLFLGDVLKGLAPAPLAEEFFEKFNVTPDDIMDAVYSNAAANRNLRTYSFFLADHLADDYVHTLIYNEMMRFFKRNVSQYDYKAHPVSIVGSVATTYSTILQEVAAQFGATIQKIILNSMPGLVTYHTTE